MKTKLQVFLVLISFFAVLSVSYSQLPNQNMVLIANLNQHFASQLYSACWGYTAPNGTEYAILGCPTGTSFVKVSTENGGRIREVGFLAGSSSSWREMKVYSHYAYIVSEATNSGVQIVDLQYLPDSIHYIGKYTYSGYDHTHSIQQQGPYLYLNGGNSCPGGADVGGTAIIDLTVNPEAPVKRGQWASQYVHDCRVRNDTIYACNIYDPPGTISVINAANKDNPITITSWVNNPNPFPHNCDLAPGRSYIYTTDETSSPNGKLKVWNITNLSNVTFVTSWQPTNITTAIVHNVERSGNYLCIAHYTAGVRLVSIANPTAPTEVAWYDTYPTNDGASYNGCWGVFVFPSGLIIGSDRQTGLYVLRTSFILVGNNNNGSNIPETYTLGQNYPNPFNPSTTIKFAIPKNEYVRLNVFDAEGKEVGILMDEYKTAGEYRVSYDANRLASGIYFYTLNAGDFSETRKMILLK